MACRSPCVLPELSIFARKREEIRSKINLPGSDWKLVNEAFCGRRGVRHGGDESDHVAMAQRRPSHARPPPEGDVVWRFFCALINCGRTWRVFFLFSFFFSVSTLLAIGEEEEGVSDTCPVVGRRRQHVVFRRKLQADFRGWATAASCGPRKAAKVEVAALTPVGEDAELGTRNHLP